MSMPRRLTALLVSFAMVLGSAPLGQAAAPVAVPPPAIVYSAYNGHPKLVVILVIDQFRGDYLERYRADFKGHGFRLFLDKGAYFSDCYYDYANTKTAPGHATLGTGAYSDGHGIAGNEWWDLDRNKDRPISSVEDERYRQVGQPEAASPDAAAKTPAATTPTADAAAKPAPESGADSAKAPAPPKYVIGASPRNLLASTVGDELRLATHGQSSVYGISLKDRAAILPAGSAANAAFWIDQTSGYFVTSTYYAPQLPEWATSFNMGGRVDQAWSEATTVPAAPVAAAPVVAKGKAKASAKSSAKAKHTAVAPEAPTPVSSPPVSYPSMTGGTGAKSFYSVVGRTPAANSYELDFAKALIAGEKLGQHPTTDLLTVSLSANDILGHVVGPDSDAQRAMVDSLDTDLDGFFTWLDKNVDGGLGNVWIALSADHGIAPIPAEAAKLGMASASIDLIKLAAGLDDAMNLKFSPGEKIVYLLPKQELPYLELNSPAFEKAGINETEAEEAVQKALPAAVDALAPAPPKTLPSEARLDPRPTLVRSYTRLQLAGGEYPRDEFGQVLAHSYSPNGGWYVMTVFSAYQMEALTGIQTTHFSPWSYDRHVPLGFFGAPFAPGIYRGRVGPVDLAATLASLLGINQPSASVGHVLTQALRPATAVGYSKPVVAPVRKRAKGSTAEPGSEPAPEQTPVVAPPAVPPPAVPPRAGSKGETTPSAAPTPPAKGSTSAKPTAEGKQPQ